MFRCPVVNKLGLGPESLDMRGDNQRGYFSRQQH